MMDRCDVLILRAVSISLHTAVACAWLSRRAGRALPSRRLPQPVPPLACFSLWIAVIGLYR